jgi:hypothetical protein
VERKKSFSVFVYFLDTAIFGGVAVLDFRTNQSLSGWLFLAGAALWLCGALLQLRRTPSTLKRT